MRDGRFMPGVEAEGGDDSDTAEYETRKSRVYRGQAAARGGRGYWIGPDEDGAGTGAGAAAGSAQGASRGARPSSGRRSPVVPGSARPNARRDSLRSRSSAAQPGARRGRRTLLWMVSSLVVLVALVIFAALVLTGEVVLPGVSGKLFPIHYQDEIAGVADKYDQDPYLVAAMVKTESGYDPTAESGAGAVGLMQLMPATAEWAASRMDAWQEGSGPQLTDPEDSLELGTWYLAYLGDIYGDGSLAAVAAYNGGLGNVDDWIDEAGGPGSFDATDIAFPETREYVERVERYRALYVRMHAGVFSQTSQVSGFQIQADYQLTGDQPQAVARLVAGLQRGDRYQTLLGVTGSGKTFTMANIIAQAGRPALIMAPNKTLAAQLCNEFREFLPTSAVEYFVSYYDYYQPEAYLPASDTYIEKDSAINQEIDRLRHAATSSLLMRRDVVIVASVSCIYGLGSPAEYLAQVVLLKQGDEISRDEVFGKLVKIHYERNDMGFARGKFRVRGDSFEVWPAYDDYSLRVSLWGDQVEEIVKVDPLTQEIIERLPAVAIYPATHFVTSDDAIERSLGEIASELEVRVAELETQGKQLEAFRLRQRTQYDMEMLRELGYCNGIENYSRILAGREPGSPPYTLLDFFPKDFLVFIDESHMTVPQLHGMYQGDRSRKTMLVEHGFRLPVGHG